VTLITGKPALFHNLRFCLQTQKETAMHAFKKFIGAACLAALSLPMPTKASNSDLVLVQLTPTGWQVVTAQLLALTTGVISGNGNATTILNNINLGLIPGAAQFCIGYGGNFATPFLGNATLQSILALPGASSSSGGHPCLKSGPYLVAPQYVSAHNGFNLEATVIGISPTGTMTLDIDGQAHSQLQIVTAKNQAVQTVTTTVSLQPGWHQLSFRYSGDTQNPASQSNVAWVYAAPPTPPAPTLYVYRSQSPLKVGQTHTAVWEAYNADTLYAACTSTGTGYQGAGYLPLQSVHSMVNPAEWVGYPIHCVWTATGPGGTATYEEWITTEY
jgi:hypothetical protein